MSTDDRAAHQRAESHAAAVQTGTAIACNHLRYLTDLLDVVRIFHTGPHDELQLAFWTAYVREILGGMHARLGPETTSAVLLTIAREIENELRKRKPS